MRSLIVDVAGLLFRIAAVQKSKQYDTIEGEDLVGLCMHMSLMSIKKWYEKYNPDKIVFAFEGGNNWRKTYTKEHSSEIRIQYKANRVYDPTMQHFYELINQFKDTVQAHTSIICLCIPTLEADDLIGGYCNLYAKDNHEIFILSGDRDFIQLLKNPNVKLVNPDDGKLRNQPGDKKYESDLDYWLFLKCVRGDMGDHVPSAFPRVRENKIKAAYENDYDRINFMNTTWEQELEDGTKHSNHVGKLFEHNKTLMSLYDQPDYVKRLLNDEIPKQMEYIGKYNYFHFLKFCGQFKLESISKQVMSFTDLFSCNQLFNKNGPKSRNNISLEEVSEEKIIENKIKSEMSQTEKLKRNLHNLRIKNNMVNF